MLDKVCDCLISVIFLIAALIENIGMNENDWMLYHIGSALDLLDNSNDLYDLIKNYKN